MILRYNGTWCIIFSSLGVLLGHIVVEPNSVDKKIDNPVTGKRYLMFKKEENWTMAKESCEKMGYELVQMPTSDEQDWVKKKLAKLKEYWVGADKFGQHFYWIVPNGKISVDVKRIFTTITREPKLNAHDDHLHGANPSNLLPVICQQDYSKEEGNFEKLEGRHGFGKTIEKTRGGMLLCASKCMMSVGCKSFTLDLLKGYCQLREWFKAISVHKSGINCDSSSIACFGRM